MQLPKLHGTTLLPPQPWEVAIVDSSGFSFTMVRFAIAFFSSIPIAIMLRNMPTANTRHWFAAITGFLLIYYPFGNGTLNAVIPSALTYLSMRNFKEHCGTLTWLIAFPYLLFNHITLASGLSWKEGALDFTGAQMVLTLKLIAIAMCYQDGIRHRPKKGPDGDATSEQPQREYSKNHQLTRCPSPLEFYSYLFAAGNLLSGPFHEAKEYFDYIERKNDWDESKKPLPNAIVPGIYRFIKALMCAGVWYYATAVLGLNSDFLESKEWREDYSFLVRVAFLHLTVSAYRFKYYFVWCVSESAFIFSGLGFEGYDAATGKAQWNRYISSNIRKVELNPSIADTPRHWNVCTGLWLRHYVYERLSPIGRKPSFFNMIVTQLISGIWHGVFAGYWLFFATSAFMFDASRVLYKYEKTWSPKIKSFIPWILIKLIIGEAVLSYSGSAFIVLSFAEATLVWRSVYFFGHAVVFSIWLIGIVMPPKRVKEQQQNVEPEKKKGA